MEVSADAVDALPTFQLTSSSYISATPERERGPAGAARRGRGAPLPGGGEATGGEAARGGRLLALRAEAGFRALCEALSFSGLQQELPARSSVNGVTVIAPSDAAFAQIAGTARGRFKLVRHMLQPRAHLPELYIS